MSFILVRRRAISERADRDIAAMTPLPTADDPEVQTAAVTAIMPEIIEWLGDNQTAYSRDRILNDLLWIAHLDDGYRAARILETHCGWEPDENLVDILAMLTVHRHVVLSAALIAWSESPRAADMECSPAPAAAVITLPSQPES